MFPRLPPDPSGRPAGEWAAGELHTVTADERPAVQVLLVDHSRLFTEVLRRRLMTEPDIAAVWTAITAPEARRLMAEKPISVVVATPVLARDLWAQGRPDYGPPGAPVIVLADSSDEHHVHELFRLGVVGWVDRAQSSDVLIEAIRTCRHGEVSIPRDVLAALTRAPSVADPPQSSRDDVLSLLTRRETEVFELLEQGLGRAEIAAALHLSPNTVRTHVHRILRRLDVHSTLAAVARGHAGDHPSRPSSSPGLRR